MDFKVIFSVLTALVFLSAPATAAPRPLSKLVRDLIASPDSPGLHYELGQAYAANGVLPQAEKEFLSAINLAKMFPRKGGPPEKDMLKSYLRAARSQRSLASEQKRLYELRRTTPADADAALWQIEVHLEKGEVDAARSILNSFPQLKHNEDLLARWVGATAGAGARNLHILEERFADLATLMDLGSAEHKSRAARQLLDLAARMPPAIAVADRRRKVQSAFEFLKSSGAETDQLAVHATYLDVLDLWKSRDQALTLLQSMRRTFPRLARDPEFFHRLAQMENQAGRAAEALTALNESFRLGLDRPDARLLLADLLMQKASSTPAVEEYVKAMEGPMPAPDRTRVMAAIEKWVQTNRDASSAPNTALLQKIAQLMPESPAVQIACARRMESLGKFEEAYSRFASAAALDPSAMDAREGLIRTLVRLERWPELDAALARIEAGPLRSIWDRWPVYPVGKKLLALGDTGAVRDRIGKSLAQRRATPDELSLAADLSMSEGNVREVIRLYADLKQKRPLTQIETRKLTFAQKAFTHSLKPHELPPMPAETPAESDESSALRLAGILRKENNLSGAADVLLKFEPKSSRISQELADLHAAMGQWGMAAAWQEKSSDNPEDNIRAAWYWFRAGQYEDASRYAPAGSLFEAVLDAESGRPEKLQKKNMDMLRRLVGEIDASAPGGRQRRMLNRWTADLIDAANRRLSAGDAEAAIGLCDEVLRRADEPEALYVKALAHLKIGLYDRAEDLLKDVSESPEWAVSANLKLGQLELLRGRPDEALRHLDHAGPGTDPGEVILAWGMALALTKSPDQGEQVLRQAARRSDRGKFFLGQFLQGQGRSKEAGEIYASIVASSEPDSTVSPYHEFSARRLETLRR